LNAIDGSVVAESSSSGLPRVPVRPLAAFAVIVSATLCAYYFPFLCGGKTPFVSDHTYYFEPFTKYIGTALVSGHLPLWNPNLYCGMPQLAVPSPGIFYPLMFLFGLMQYAQALALTLLLNQVVAAVGGFLLVESCGWGLPAATICGIGMSMSGYMFSLTTNHTIVAGAAWIPLMFWALRKIKLTVQQADGTRPYLPAFFACLACFMMIAAGRPEIFAPGFLLAFLYCLLEAQQSPTQRWRQLIWQFASLTAAVLTSMPIVLPVLEWVAQSPRAHGLNLSQSLMWSTNWYDLLGIVCPQPFGDLQILGALHLALVATRPVYQPYIQSCFLGPIFITAAIWGFADKSWRWRFHTLLVLSCILILCLGEFTPVTPWMMQVMPPLTMFRYPIKWIFFFLAGIILAASRGTYAFSRASVTTVGRFCAVSVWIVFLLLAIPLLFSGSRGNVLSFTVPPLSADAQVCLGGSMLISTAVGAMACLLEYWAALVKPARPKALLLLVAAAGISLLAPAVCFFPLSTSTAFYKSEQFMSTYIKEAQTLKKTHGRFLSLYFDPLWCPADFRCPTDSHWTPAFFNYARNLLLPNSNLDANVAETNGYEAGETGPFRSLFLDVLHKCSICLPGGHRLTDRTQGEHETTDWPLLRFCQCTSTMWLGTQSYKGELEIPRLDARFFELVKENRQRNVRLYQNLHPLPRAYLSQYWMWCDKQSEIWEKIKSNEEGGFNPAAYTLVERDVTTGISDRKGTNKFLGALIYPPPRKAPPIPQAVLKSSFADRDPLIMAQPVTIMVDEPTHLSLSVNTDRFCFLVLTDHFYPGWQVSIDGALRHCYRANVEGRAVYMTPGAHLIEFNYVPESLQYGFYLASIGGIFLLAVLYGGLHPFVMKVLRRMTGETES